MISLHAPLSQYLHVRGSTPDPLFLLSDGTPLHRQWLTSSIQSILSAAGVFGCYTSHSFHVGAATSAAPCGLPDHLIKMLCRWSSEAYPIYIRTHVSTIVRVASLLTCVSFPIPSCFCSVPWDVDSSGPGLPPALSPSFPLRSGMHQLGVGMAWNGGSWLGCGDLPTMGAVFYLGAGWPQWKPLGIPGTHRPLKQGRW